MFQPMRHEAGREGSGRTAVSLSSLYAPDYASHEVPRNDFEDKS
jgi:hypothetical protein